MKREIPTLSRFAQIRKGRRRAPRPAYDPVARTTILVPTEGPGGSRRAVDAASRLAQLHRAQLVLLQVFEGPRERRAERQQKDRRALERLAALRRTYLRSGLVVHAVQRRGNALEELMTEANLLPADYVVLDVRSSKGLGRSRRRTPSAMNCRLLLI
jgi:nucleotide-binding universal stress UspA family protein